MSCSTFNLPSLLVIFADKVSPLDNIVSEHEEHVPEVAVADPPIL